MVVLSACTFFANGKTVENIKQEPLEIELELEHKEAKEDQLKYADTNEILEDAEMNVEANSSVRKLRKRLPVNYKKQL